MSKINELKPELRFPDFAKEGKWEVKELNSLGELINGLTFSPSDVRDRGLLVLRSSNIQNGLIDLNDCVFVRPDIRGANLSQPDDILVCVRNGSKALIGKNALIPKGLPLATHGAFMTIFRAQNPGFVFQLFQTDDYTKQVKADLGATINSINGANFLKYEFPVPKNSKEQEKIASCLSSLDEVIAAYREKLDLLKEHKKGLMQNLFPQEGEKVPKYRFKAFAKDGEWAEKSLNEVASFFKGKGISKADIDENGVLPCIRYGELYTHYKETIRQIKSFTNLNAEDLVLSKANDVIIPASGETQEDIATASCVLEGGIALGGDLNIIRTKINGVFLSYLLNNVKKREIAQLAQGISVVHLYSNQLKTLKIIFPKLKEQQKIASCLASLDDLVVELEERIEQLKLHKMGLMQGLFPKIDHE
jgi:type I restriction enzyme, S subunit